MKLCFLFLFVFFTAFSVCAQESGSTSLKIGDPAPAMKMRRWIKGTMVNEFQKGKIYVVEFWATWCLPCIAGMPHLSKLAKEYRNKVTVTGISILERARTTEHQVDSFVNSMGSKMDYHVGREDSNFMAKNWLNAAGERGIPFAFVIDQQGRIAWMGHPKKLDPVLAKLANGTWDLRQAAAEREEMTQLRKLDNDVIPTLNRYMGNPGKPDSALMVIDQLVTQHPQLKYAPRMGHFSFYSFIKTDPAKAAIYGRALMNADSYDDPPYKSITDAVSYMTEIRKQEVPKEVYELAASAYQAQIDNYPWSMNLPLTYGQIADLHLKAGNRENAIQAQVKAINAAKGKKDFPPDQLEAMMKKLGSLRGKNE